MGACRRDPGHDVWLLNMGMVIDVILAVAVISVATGAITEFQLRVAHICASADSAAVGVVLCWPRG